MLSHLREKHHTRQLAAADSASLKELRFLGAESFDGPLSLTKLFQERGALVYLALFSGECCRAVSV